MHSVDETVRRFFARHQPVCGGRVVVAVSGGQDSVCLLHVLVRLKDELGLGLQVAHLDHQLRGAESEADARYVAELAGRLGVLATIERRDVRGYRARRGASLEEAAREVRYGFLAEVAQAAGAGCVAVGHTRNDHAETVLLHLVRGSGTGGLRGLQPVSRRHLGEGVITVIRPLLEVSREATAEYCRFHGLEPRSDASNDSLSALRNRIRHQLLPLLEEYNPRVVDALVRTAGIVTDDLAWLDAQSQRVWEGLVCREGDTVILDRAELSALPVGLQRNLLRRALGELTGDLRDIEARHIEEMVAGLGLPAGRRLRLPGGLWFAVDYGRCLLGREPAALCPFPELGTEFPLSIPGETSAPGWQITASVIKPEGAPDVHDELTACLDFEKVAGAVTVRGRRPGDRFQPLGMGRTKKLGRFMIDAQVPRDWRERVPVVCAGDSILWLVGYRIDDRVKVTEGTRQVLKLSFERR